MGRSCAVVSLACVACVALLLLPATYQTTGGGGPRNLFQPRDGDVVAIKSWHTGMYVDVRSTDMQAMIRKAKEQGLRKVEINAHRDDNAFVQVDDAVAKILANRQAIQDSDSESDSDDSGSDFTDSD